MSGHTPTPWECAELGDYGDFGGNSVVILSVDKYGGQRLGAIHTYDTDKCDNARRIVAAVNGTATLSTEALEAGVVDKLVEALEWLEGYLRDTPHHNAPAAANARSALALARGEQA